MPHTLLDREEYVEQAYFFRVVRERLRDNLPVQEILLGIRDEILSTTKLPLAIDYLIGELHLNGTFGKAMVRLNHYFTPFQAFILGKSEDETARLDFRIALHILEREAEFRAEGELNPAALFVYQFECLARNRLGYDYGMQAIAGDPAYSEPWKAWILQVRFQLGTVDFADLMYLRSEQALQDHRQRKRNPDLQAAQPILFDERAGRIARANHGKDPLYMFAALQRQLGYPAVPRPKPPRQGPLFEPQVETRFQRLEGRVALLEQEQRGGLDLKPFMRGPESNDVDAASE